ncbi:MAG: hypothetical protein IJB72_01325 [Clostridia bacterium]|nr:hypothetical protein [Clostridia bacterium]
MLKKLMLPILVVSIVVQLLVPVGMIAYGNKAEDDLQKYGKEFKIPVYIQNIYNGSVEVKFYDYFYLYNTGDYIVLEENENGYTNLEKVQSKKPKTHDYIYVTSENQIKLGAEFLIDADITAWRIREESAYLVIKVYNGNFEIVELYMDGVPAEEWFKNATAETDEYGEITLK